MVKIVDANNNTLNMSRSISEMSDESMTIPDEKDW